MIAIGYMLKAVAPLLEGNEAPKVDRVYSVSGCISPAFTDFIPQWKHNGWWLFDSPKTLYDLAEANRIDLSTLTLFFYEAFENEYVERAGEWRPIMPSWHGTNVDLPDQKTLCGYDVVTYSGGSSPECSPLSCNGLAKDMKVNKWCLFDEFSTAHRLLEQGSFNKSEPGPYRIISVYTVN